MRFIVTISLLAALALVSCSGGSTLDPVNQPGPVDEADPATITGTVEIYGTPLSGLDDSTNIGLQDAKNWSVKLIDPVEDVDSIVIPVSNTTFSSGEVTVAGDYLLSISFQPAVDLSGGSEAVTPVTVNIPVSVAEGEITQVYASLEVLAPMMASTVHSASQMGGGGGRLRFRYAIETPGHRDTGFVELDWVGNRIRRDTNGDDDFDDEEYFADSDRDGISDELHDQMRDRMQQQEEFTVEGVMTELDPAQHRFLLGDSWYRFTDRTQVFQHTRLIHLSNLEEGQLLRIKGHISKMGKYYAEEIRVVSQTDRPPADR